MAGQQQRDGRSYEEKKHDADEGELDQAHGSGFDEQWIDKGRLFLFINSGNYMLRQPVKKYAAFSLDAHFRGS